MPDPRQGLRYLLTAARALRRRYYASDRDGGVVTLETVILVVGLAVLALAVVAAITAAVHARIGLIK